jgi:hypothetical protein
LYLRKTHIFGLVIYNRFVICFRRVIYFRLVIFSGFVILFRLRLGLVILFRLGLGLVIFFGLRRFGVLLRFRLGRLGLLLWSWFWFGFGLSNISNKSDEKEYKWRV